PNPPATARRSTNRKQLTVKTINKAKSCSALNQHSPPSLEPLTPVSSHGPNFFNIPGVPFNSPVDEIQQQAADPEVMPFSFSDLYNFGLAVDSVEEIDPRKSPMAFATDISRSPAANNSNNPQTYTDDADFNHLHSLPTPYLAHGSGFSSPSSTYLSDPSPDLVQHRSPVRPQSSGMLSAPTEYSIPFSNGPPHPSPSRQRCATYASRRGGDDDSSGHLNGAPSTTSMQRGTSIPSYGAPRFSYPTRFGSDQGQSNVAVAGPYSTQGWSDQALATYSILPPADQPLTNLFPPTPGSHYDAKYEENLEAFEDMYDHYSQSSPGYATPNGKRGREEDFDYGAAPYSEAPNGDDMPGSATPRKRLRTVASAPMLGSPRRMRPGPKPKVTKSPQEACQSVFSANLSPPPVPFRRGTSPFSGGESDNYGTDDEDNAGGGSVTRDTIQSFYEGVPGHTLSNGQKVPKRYMCLIEGCERLFPRKSAIESHIQTHLEDKPFVCPQADCDAAFVRQHDLRRHERIHSGNKPFPCPCGKGFARGDALARHRARGICSGSLVPRRI
ncbi:hypothetical protein P7C70_g4675, partial [Phenoliferia sp. Uapishka_3]